MSYGRGTVHGPMPTFFLPYIDDPAKAAEFYEAVVAFSRDTHGWAVDESKRIFRLEYVHNGKEWEAEVGQPHPYGHPTTWEYVPDYSDAKAGEWVVAILECDPGPFLVCTHNRGVVRGEPILVGDAEVRTIEYFDGYAGEEP